MNVIDWDLKKVAIIVAIATVLGLVIFLFVKIAVPIIQTSDATEKYADRGVDNMYVQNVDKFNQRFKKYDNKHESKAIISQLIQDIKTSNKAEDQTHIITCSFRGVDYTEKQLDEMEKEIDKTLYSVYSIKLEKDKNDYYCKAVIDVVEESKANRNR